MPDGTLFYIKYYYSYCYSDEENDEIYYDDYTYITSEEGDYKGWILSLDSDSYVKVLQVENEIDLYDDIDGNIIDKIETGTRIYNEVSLYNNDENWIYGDDEYYSSTSDATWVYVYNNDKGLSGWIKLDELDGEILKESIETEATENNSQIPTIEDTKTRILIYILGAVVIAIVAIILIVVLNHRKKNKKND